MKPIFLRTSKDSTSKTQYLWEKTVYLFGIKLAKWTMDSKKEDEKIGFNKD